MKSKLIRRTCSMAAAAIALSSTQAALAQSEPYPRAHLRSGDFVAVDRWFLSVQSQFETGHMTEFDLRDAYRPLYELDDQILGQLKAWAERMPSSYAAHVLLGIQYKHRGDAARGGNFVQDTPHAALEEMHRQYEPAMRELERSTQLAAKPYMSWFIMLGIAQQEGSADLALALLDKSVRANSISELVRVRYMTTLTPRWGGSYPQMEAFIARSRREGVPDRVIHELQAIEENDLGDSRSDAGDERGARLHFEKALALAKDSAPFFLQDALGNAQNVLCRGTSRPAANCPR